MGLFEWLSTPAGQGVAHALELLLLALVGFITAQTARIAHSNGKLLNGHLRDHLYGSGDREELARHRPSDPADR